MKPLLALLALVSPLIASGVGIRETRCEYHENPLAIGTLRPRFSWKLQAADPAARDLHQTAFEIQVAGDMDGFAGDLLWASGRVESAATDQIEYAGKPLASRGRGVWRVRIWDGGKEPSGWSEPASFGIGLHFKKPTSSRTAGWRFTIRPRTPWPCSMI
jgi:alpha-L-rhamnosidase